LFLWQSDLLGNETSPILVIWFKEKCVFVSPRLFNGKPQIHTISYPILDPLHFLVGEVTGKYANQNSFKDEAAQCSMPIQLISPEFRTCQVRASRWFHVVFSFGFHPAMLDLTSLVVHSCPMLCLKIKPIAFKSASNPG